jgi:ferredoxin-thioredoxin reductase catalytic subunit
VCEQVQTDEILPAKITVFLGSIREREKLGTTMWKRNCPVCRQLLEKKQPTETVSCPCGKFLWKG